MNGRAKFDFSGASSIVTGATKGIGRGIAGTLVDAGANVVVNSRTESDVRQVVEELQADATGDVVGISADISDQSDIRNLVAESAEAFGPIDLLVNNAAVWPREESILDASLDQWDAVMDVNVRGPFYCSKLVGEQMVENGVEGNIIHITSQAGDRRAGDSGLYGVSKTAINGLTWRMACDFGKHDIRVNAITTSRTDTYQLRKGIELNKDVSERSVEEVLEQFGREIPLGKVGVPEDIGNAVLFLASEHAEYVTGSIVSVSGGDDLQ